MGAVSDYRPQARPTEYGTFWVVPEIIEHKGSWSGVYRVMTLAGKDEVEASGVCWTEDEAEAEITRLRAAEDALHAARDERRRA